VWTSAGDHGAGRSDDPLLHDSAIGSCCSCRR
jgi:hypothetical protein